MAIWTKRSLAGAEEAITQFGLDLRFSRMQAGISQMSLEGRSGVDQTLISKLERAKAPHVSLERLIRLHIALGDAFPLGHCPHDHDCTFRRRELVSNRRHVP